MLYDIDLIDQLVTLIQSASWASQVTDVRRVWGGDVTESEIRAGTMLVQLWPDTQRHTRATGRAAPWSLEVQVGVMFATQILASTMQEVDRVARSLDDLLIGQQAGIGSDLLDVVTVTSSRSGTEECETFVRQPSIEWPVRPDLGNLQRLVPDGPLERYSGLFIAQCVMTYVRL